MIKQVMPFQNKPWIEMFLPDKHKHTQLHMLSINFESIWEFYESKLDKFIWHGK